MLGKPSRRLRKHLEEKGSPASGLILEIAEKGMSVTSGNEAIVSNTEVVLKCKLQVEPASGEPSFEVEEKFRFAQLGIPVAGMRLPILYDPSDHEKLMIDPSGGAGGAAGAPLGGQDVGALLSEVQEAQAKSGGDPEELARLLQQQLGSQAQVITGGGSAGGGAAAAGTGWAPAQTPAVGSGPTDDTLEQLEKLGELRDKGVLTEQEFQMQKQRILGG